MDKICPECKDGRFLMWSVFNDGTTDCGGCAGNFEEDELEEIESEVINNG